MPPPQALADRSAPAPLLTDEELGRRREALRERISAMMIAF